MFKYYNMNQNNIVKINKINKDAICPSYAHKDDAGMDLYSIDNYIVAPQTSCSISTGLIIHIPKYHYGKIEPRSGVSLKNVIGLGGGVIDHGYNGEIKIIVFNHGKNDFIIKKGTKIAQLVIIKILENPVIEFDGKLVEFNNEKKRENNGFGSTGHM